MSILLSEELRDQFEDLALIYAQVVRQVRERIQVDVS